MQLEKRLKALAKKKRPQPESRFQSRIIEMLEEEGALVFNVHGHSMQAPGWPDLYFAHPLLEGWLELKITSRLRAAQKIVLRKLAARGVFAYVLRMGSRLALEDHEGNVVAEYDSGRLVDWLHVVGSGRGV